MKNPSVNLGETTTERIDEQCDPQGRSQWVRTAAEIRLEIERAADSAGVETDDLPDGWWHAFLFNATRAHLSERTTDEPREIEA